MSARLVRFYLFCYSSRSYSLSTIFGFQQYQDLNVIGGLFSFSQVVFSSDCNEIFPYKAIYWLDSFCFVISFHCNNEPDYTVFISFPKSTRRKREPRELKRISGLFIAIFEG